MPNKCVVCGNRRNKNSTFSFHRFPKVKEIRKQWVQACKVNEQDITSESLVCSKHFKVEDFDAKVWPRNKLVEGVVPTPSIIYDLCGKSKKIKLDNEKNIKVHTGPQSIGELEWVNHEIIIKDEHVEEKSNNGPLKSVHDQNSCEDDNSNVKENYQSDIPEVRLSSLANISQVAMEYGPTHSSIVSQNEMKTSTSINIAGTNNIDLMKDNTDEDTDEELGLNSLEELEQFWEFIVELHDYNKQLIRAQQNKKRRYLLQIKKFEHDLQHNYGIELEKCEEENDESSDGNLKIPSNIEEKNVTLKNNESMEKE
ncbi:hypothetical protein WA026_014057 [Henosepilachna vigintioctopunctata]|uniref:THAP-type domain-containing protein n=1 Tax=Henosepilachna vigintioctopunctata TaxID=420089 RepID=A0AAW1U1C2_9CUCU